MNDDTWWRWPVGLLIILLLAALWLSHQPPTHAGYPYGTTPEDVCKGQC